MAPFQKCFVDPFVSLENGRIEIRTMSKSYGFIGLLLWGGKRYRSTEKGLRRHVSEIYVCMN